MEWEETFELIFSDAPSGFFFLTFKYFLGKTIKVIFQMNISYFF